MTTDPVIHAMQAAQDFLRHAMRIEAAHHLRTARSLAGEHAWTVQDLRDAWTALKAQG